MKLLFTLLSVMTIFVSTASAQSMGFSAGQYYSSRFSIQDQCSTVGAGIDYYGRRLCRNVCQRAVWRQRCGAQYANAYVCNYYGQCGYINASQSACVWVFNWNRQTSGPFYCGF